jgi:SAM-dependent methyltransferase
VPDHAPVRRDYDDPDSVRWQVPVNVLAEYGITEDVHSAIARRFTLEGLTPVLDVGGGKGALADQLAAGQWIGLDGSPAQLTHASRLGPTVLAEATDLPIAASSVPGVACLYMLYHLSNPLNAIAEAHRVLRPGGLFAACTTSRYDDPEFAGVIPPEVTTFDAELGPGLVASVFGTASVEIQRWDLPGYILPDAQAIRHYLNGRFVPADAVERAATELRTPLTVTKRGAIIYARR